MEGDINGEGQNFIEGGFVKIVACDEDPPSPPPLEETLHSYKEKVFLQHKRNKKFDNRKKKKNPKHKSQVQLNLQPSLSCNRIDLLRKANEAIEGNVNVKFAYADMHGNLKLILSRPLNRKYVTHLRSKEDIVNITSVCCQEDEF